MTRPIALLIALAIALVAGIIAYSSYNKEFDDLATLEADVTLTPTALFEAFNTDETAANEAYLNKVIEVSGTVSAAPQIQDSSAVLVITVPAEAFGISCSLSPSELSKVQNLKTGDDLTIRGVCTGFLMDVNLVRCVIL